MSDSQHKPPHVHEAGTSFEDGRRVLVEDFKYPNDEPKQNDQCDNFELEPFIDLFLRGAPDASSVGQRLILLSFLMPRVPSRPKTLRELGARLGCSHVAARARLTRLRLDFAGEIAALLNKGAHS